MKIFLTIYLVILFSKLFVEAVICKTSRISCRGKDSYTFCIDLGDSILFLEYLHFKCGDGKVCCEDTYFPCVLESEVPPTTTTHSPTPTTNTVDPVSTTSLGSTVPPIVTTSPQAVLTSTLLPSSTLTTLPPISTTINTPSINPTSDISFHSTTLNSSYITIPITDTPQTFPTLTQKTSTLVSITSTNFPTTTLPSSSEITSTENVVTSTKFITNTVTILQPTTAHEFKPTTDIASSLQTTTDIKLPPLTTIPEETTTTTHAPTKGPTPPQCPNPAPGKIPECKKSGQKSPGSVCTKYYECIPFWISLAAEEYICKKGKAFSASEGKCVTPPDGCVCAN